MRRIPLKIVDLEDPAGKPLGALHYSEALVLIAKAPQGGVSAAEIDTALAIEAAVAAAVEREAPAVLLEEAQWAWFADRVRANRFPFASAVFRDLAAAVTGAELFDPNQALPPSATGGPRLAAAE